MNNLNLIEETKGKFILVKIIDNKAKLSYLKGKTLSC